MSLTGFQFLPPKDWPEFERLCHALWQKIWGDPHAMMHGRSGQAQHGIDIYGRPGGLEKWAGIQCKGHDGTLGARATRDEFVREVEKAKAFQPPIGEFIFATTSPNDVELQQLARELTERHRAVGLFEVHFYGWNDISLRLSQHAAVAREFYAEFFEASSREDQPVFNATVDRDQLASIVTAGIEEAIARMPEPGPVVPLSAFEEEISYQIDACRSSIEGYRPTEAIKALQRIRSAHWKRIGTFLKWRILSNLGAANTRAGDYEAAESFFSAAYELDPDSEKANANRALGFQLVGKLDKAEAAAHEGVEKFPTSVGIFSHLLRIQSLLGKSIDLEQVPSEIRQEPDVLIQYALQLSRQGRNAEAYDLFEKILAHEPGRIDAQLHFAENVCESLLRTNRFHPAAGLATNEVDALRLASERIQAVVGKLRGSEAAKVISDCCYNISSIFFVLGEGFNAEKWIREGLAAEPENWNLVRYSAIQKLSERSAEEAVTDLRKIPPETFPDQVMLLAQALDLAGKPRDAIELLRNHLKLPASPDRLGAALELSRIVEKADGTVAASDSLGVLSPEEAKHPLAHLRMTEIALAQNDKVAGAAHAVLAKDAIGGDTPVHVAFQIAEGLRHIGEFESSVEIFERWLINDATSDGVPLRGYLGALRALGRNHQILKHVESLPAFVQSLPFYERLVARTLYNAGDLNGAIDRINRYLDREPNDVRGRLVWLSALFRSGREQEVHDYLVAHEIPEGATCDDRVDWARMSSAVGLQRLALDLSFETWRRHQRNTAAYIGLISLGFMSGSNVLPMPDTVSVDCAVGIASETGVTTVVLLVEADVEPVLSEELPVSNPLAAGLVGHRIGDTVTIERGPYGDRIGKVTWIKHKLLYGMHVALERFQVLFPGHPAISRFEYSKGEGNAAEALQPMLDAISARSQGQLRIREAYEKHHLPMGTIAKMSGASAIDVWRGLMAQGRVDCCFGNAKERADAGEALKVADKGVILDAVTLFAMYELGVATFFQQLFGNLAIPQAALDSLRDLIQHRVALGGSMMTLWKEGEQFYRREYTAEEIEMDRKRIQGVLRWAEKNCAIVPAIGSPALERRKTALKDLLDDESIDTLMAASGTGRVLLTDDLGLRSLARNEYGIPGSWTQVALQFALSKGAITISRYSTAIARLVDSNYYFISIDAQMLVSLTIQDHFVVTELLRRVFRRLDASTTEFESFLGVGASYLVSVWSEGYSITLMQARAITYTFLTEAGVALSPRSSEICAQLSSALRARGLFKAATAIGDWEEGRFLELPGGSAVSL